MSFWDKLLNRHHPSSDKDLALVQAITNLVGSKPKNLDLYKLATLHSSLAQTSEHGFKQSNERLEFLGDAVLSMVIAEYLFKKYPYREEGFLTKIRARIVNRDMLNRLAVKMGIDKMVEMQQKEENASKSIYGNALEAVIGAIYLDRNYQFCKKFIVKKMIHLHIDMDKIISKETNFKSKIIEWGQKENKEVLFETTVKEPTPPNTKFEVTLFIDGKKIAVGRGRSKKRAAQNAAFNACEQLRLP